MNIFFEKRGRIKNKEKKKKGRCSSGNTAYLTDVIMYFNKSHLVLTRTSYSVVTYLLHGAERTLKSKKSNLIRIIRQYFSN